RRGCVLLLLEAAPPAAPIACAPLQDRGNRNKVLLVSFDGFRWNYDQDVETPNLDAMARDGVKARYMTPAFVTMTSPCHFTLVTGKERERRGWGISLALTNCSSAASYVNPPPTCARCANFLQYS
uniref:Ectonucleotide pyrophosphatase/phosphodiesterase 7 n=1 Tax=Terrapene triunguis TaxID=2587831 RepID=A0A674JF72_9SAUR